VADEAFKLFDCIVFGTLLRPPTEDDLDDIRHAATDSGTDPRHQQFIYEMMQALNAKTSALLTHISLIVAALTFLYTSRSGGGLFKAMVVLEICAYLLLSIFCLRSIRMTFRMTSRFADGTTKTEGTPREEELYKRRTVYNFASNTTVFVTLFMILTLVVGAIFA